MARALTERQKRFADYYLETGNASRAAERAGYCVKYSVRLRRQPAVKEYLKGRLEALDNQSVASADEVLEYLTGVMRDGEGAAAMKAAELLGKRMGLFSEREESLPAPVIVDDIPEEK